MPHLGQDLRIPPEAELEGAFFLHHSWSSETRTVLLTVEY